MSREQMLRDQRETVHKMTTDISDWMVRGEAPAGWPAGYNSLQVILTSAEVGQVQTALAKLRAVEGILARHVDIEERAATARRTS